MRDWHVLVVEDDPDGQEVVSTILEHLNIRTTVAANAEDAERFLFGGTPFNAVIVDLALPGKDGWELLRDILANPQTANIPCVAVTAFHTSKLREEAIQAGFSAYFAKPIDSTAFARRLESLM
ncbi:MAG: response regulator [Anaerolineae bacterium]|jgi:CheY-like chemotaxis protein|nr:response regulator [Anaerolineae bacterium]